MPKRNLILILAIVLAAGVALWVTRNSSRAPLWPWGNTDQDNFAGVAAAYKHIRDDFYPIGRDRPPAEDPRIAAIRGMVESRGDKYSRYIAPDDVDWFDHRIMGVYRGVGLRAERKDGAVRIIEVMVNSPAQKASLRRDDKLLAIDGRPLDDAKITDRDIHRMLHGPPGTEARLDVIRAKTGRRERVTVRSEEFPIESVAGLYRNRSGKWVYGLEGRFAYVRISEFLPDTLEKLQEVMRDDIGPVESLKGLVLDLRDNPGGKLDYSVPVADLFLTRGTIATIFSRNAKPQKHLAHSVGTLPEFPLVVLVNEKTASGAEIVAGSLAWNDRAALVGTRTLGKGCVQTMIKLPDNLGQINITTAEYYVGDDQPVAGVGISPSPDLTVTIGNPLSDPAGAAALREELTMTRQESELAMPQPATSPSASPTTMEADASKGLLKKDPQLAKAFELVRQPKKLAEEIAKAREIRIEARTAPTTRPATEPATEK